MYLDDGAERLHLAAGQSLNQTIVQAIESYLRSVKRYVELFKWLSEEPSDEAHVVFENKTRQTHGNVSGDAHRGTEVAAIRKKRETYEP